jgi:putative oxidoreductase
MLKKLNGYFESKKAFGIIFLRVVAGWRLIAGIADYAFGIKPISEVAGFFEQLHIPVPMLSATISVYAQLICGVLFLIGLWVRPAALIMILNFSIAIIAAHTHDSIEKSFAAWALLAMSVCLLFTGGGRLSLESNRKNNKSSI